MRIGLQLTAIAKCTVARFVEIFFPNSPCELHSEEVDDEGHDHFAADVVMRRLSNSQKGVVLRCQDRKINQPKKILDEFNYFNSNLIHDNEEAIEVPTTAMITSFLSYLRHRHRGGIAVGSTTLQDVEAYTNAASFGELITQNFFYST